MIFRCQLRDRIYELKLDLHDNQCRAMLDNQEYLVDILDQRPGLIDLRIQDHSIRLYWAEKNGRTWISYQGCTYILEKPASYSSKKYTEKSDNSLVRAPMPAQVRAVETIEQALVTRGQTIILLEAMKMEIRITAPNDGQVIRILVQPGQQVDKGQLLFEIKASNI